ncbi:unnamed protein product [Adineta steineri]|uniref:NHL repeat containing protein n=1 Tax=Adineta steineri TaxID=433720 RepID=A0A815C532_9BILA|nr:unnamed protein product [Adineta steineri]CAF1280540.1 unnamed protein product [Adineta steineri]
MNDSVIVAGSGKPGYLLKDLNHPRGFYIDGRDQSIFIADMNNHRIVKWKVNAMEGELVAGGHGSGDDMDQLYHPTDVILDKNKNFLIICDSSNARVVRWSLYNDKNQEVMISNVNCYGLAMDNNGDLYVSDEEKHEVKRWKQGEINGIIVAGGNGRGNKVNQLNSPYHIFVDNDYSVYIADFNNNRVMKWIKDATEGIVIAGGGDQTNKPYPLFRPWGVIVDHVGNIYVSDSEYNRVVRWLPDAIVDCIVVGGNGFGSGIHQMTVPTDLSFDRQGNLYVADTNNHRLQRFDINIK